MLYISEGLYNLKQKKVTDLQFIIICSMVKVGDETVSLNSLSCLLSISVLITLTQKVLLRCVYLLLTTYIMCGFLYNFWNLKEKNHFVGSCLLFVHYVYHWLNKGKMPWLWKLLLWYAFY